MRKRLLGVGLLAAVLGAAALVWPVSAHAATAGLRVQYRTNGSAATNQQVSPVFSVVNGGSATVALSTLKIRYWYTKDGTQAQTYWCDWTTLGCANVTSQFVAVASPTSTADTYLEVGFSSGAGSLSPGQNTGDIQGRFAKSDWSNYTQSNDYSFDGSKIALADWSRVTLYENGTLVWGVEPTSGSTGQEGAIAVSASSLNLGTVTLGSSRSQTFAVSNSGSATLNVSMARSSSTTSEFKVSPPSFSLAAGGRKIGVVTYTPTATGSDSGSLVVTSNDPSRPSVTVSLSGVCANSDYPGCTPPSSGHTSNTNCMSCHSTNPCTGSGGYPGCTPPGSGHTSNTNCAQCHQSNPCTDD